MYSVQKQSMSVLVWVYEYFEQAREVVAAAGVGAQEDIAQIAAPEANARAPAGRAQLLVQQTVRVQLQLHPQCYEYVHVTYKIYGLCLLRTYAAAQ